MKVSKPIITGLISLTALAPIKAQNAIEISSETGVTADINKEMQYSGGLHGILVNNKNNTDIYCGMIVDPEKQFTFESELENEYSWKENLSTWFRGTFHLSKRERSLRTEIAPIKINKSFSKVDASIAPVYLIDNNFKEKENTQGLGAVLETSYNIDSNNSMKFEAEYTTEPSRNLFNTHFGKLKDSISYMLSYIKKF